MTELQKREYEILRQFIKVCEELNLRYFLVCGSALGAVKYGGFIPWDDDIDVALPRKDYEVFCQKAQKCLPDWCFLQNYHTDAQFHRLGSKLRDSRTTYIETMTDSLDINHGVFIDVFPLDGHWKSKKDASKFHREQHIFEAKRRVRLKYNRLSGSNILMIRTNIYYLLYRIFGLYGDTAKAIYRYDKYISSFPTEDSDVWCNHANSTSSLEYASKEQYGDGCWASFEGLKVRVPEDFDAYLTQKYGNWRDDPPLSEQSGHHYYLICDTRRPYTEYIQSIHSTGRPT